jgi:PPOX class probable FMN-dependent enzyme
LVPAGLAARLAGQSLPKGIAVQNIVTSEAELDALYGKPVGAAVIKEIPHISEHYRRFIEVSPFVVLATSGPEGLDCTPRGDPAGFVRVVDSKTVMLPDRRGNNRIDTLRNIVRDPRVSLLFLVPGVGETLRVIGRASITTDPTLCESFAFAGKTPRAIIVVAVESVYFQCSKAVIRSKLWDASRQIDRSALPSNGTVLAEITKGREGGAAYDEAYPARLKETIY